MKNSARLLLVGCLLLLVVAEVSARIISYAPVSDQIAVPAVQSRLARHYLLMESKTAFSGGVPIPILMPPISPARRGPLVLYDSKGEQEPRVILSGKDPEPAFWVAALFEGADEKPMVLVATDADPNGDNPQRLTRLLYSPDAGTTWRVVQLPPRTLIAADSFREDVGGPIVRGRGAQIRLGTATLPFIFATVTESRDASAVYAIRADGTPRLLLEMAGEDRMKGCCLAARVIGSDLSGSRFLVTGALPMNPMTGKLRIVDLFGAISDVTEISSERSLHLEGWITPDGGVYIEDRDLKTLTFYRSGAKTSVASALPGAMSTTGPTFFAAPTADFSGAWIIQRGNGLPTILSRHQPGGQPAEQWRDITGPEVEAIHAGSSGQRLLIQVHRPRPMADQQRLFIDPALAIWEVGQPAPRDYDELYLIEGPGKAFVHLDVEKIGSGEPFVFDSASITFFDAGPIRISPPPSAGGGDVIQEWGVVRASLQQRLVLPGIARIAGAYGSFWRSDIVIRNSSAGRVGLNVRYVPTYAGMDGAIKDLVLEPGEIRVIRDALKTLLDIDTGGGAFFLTPQLGHAVHVTSRTYTDSAQGTYGMGAGAIDLFAAASPRFPVTFSGAFQGPDFRTNVLVTDAGGRGTNVELQVAGNSGIRVQSASPFVAPAGGQSQFNAAGALLNLAPWETGALLMRPITGEAIGSVVMIDNRTNDPTWFPPDLPAPYVRTIPVIGHLDGANNSKFRSDLFLFNPAAEVKTVILAMKMWNEPSGEVRLNFTLLPHESKMIRDVLFTAFGKTGLARLRYQSGSPNDSIGIRATSRTYTMEESGATYGLEIPPLNSFQSATPGDSLEILGAFGDPNFRTNLALVELSAFANGTNARVRVEIIDDRGATIDSFETNVPIGGGIQLLDLFRERGLGAGPRAAVIRISPFGGIIGAFATNVDNGTNDPTLLSAALASR